MEHSRDTQTDHNISAGIPALAVSDDCDLFFFLHRLFAKCATYTCGGLEKCGLFK